MAKGKQESGKGGKAQTDNSKAAGKKGGKGAGGGEGDAKSTSKVKGAQSINVRHILCEKHAESEKAMERLRNGEKFDAVARDMSQDKARQGGSLGWKSKGSLDPEFEKIAFELPQSTVDAPKYDRVKTQFGYHIIMVEGRK
ncbi:peptidyl-prolyl cis-trans isomerase PIN4 [Canariomyces notabilis]|uniref:Peptidyl-prolyl cis-trans isomerase n=1 Tax=Canariomyces notabilis TaxID=2074819 RepID=A0AAN6YW73_9PEZI|nr:peptidyl-prolyl cis-trans isomerase PIN4 [Canariomyces arenarius]